MIGIFTGTIISPYAFKVTGYYGVFAIKQVLVSLALLYMFIFVKNTKVEPEVSQDSKPEIEKKAKKSIRSKVRKLNHKQR